MGVNSSLLRLLLIRLTAWISITNLWASFFGNSMARRDQAGGSQHATHAQFQSTHWSLVLQAGKTSHPGGYDALSKLCQTYWFPLYAFIRREGTDSHRAKDLTQGFFLHLLQGKLIKQAKREKGRFRSFLLTCLTNFKKDEWRKEKAAKRGGKGTIFSIDEIEAEEKYRHLPVKEPDATKTFDRAWAATVIEQVMQNLKQAYTAKGKIDLYEVLKRSLTGGLSPDSYAREAFRLEMTKETFQVHLSRFKDAFGEIVRSEISKIVDRPAEIDDEIRYLMSAWTEPAEADLLTKTKFLSSKPGG
jgi:DNA-directed RNA polymerase specialized sigma24 family protein